jgi:hypothetical protein
MKLKFVSMLLIVLCSASSFAQSDTLNQLDASLEKSGWWIIYLDDDLKQLKDSTGASYCRYTFYTGKFDHYNMGTIGSKKNPIQFPESDTLKIGNFKWLNGDYIANHKNGNVHFILSAKSGILTEYKEFYANGILKSHLIYSKECGAPIRTCIKSYDKHEKLTYSGHNRIPED